MGFSHNLNRCPFCVDVALTTEFDTLLTEAEKSGPPRRDIGALLNKMLTQNLRYMSMRASMARKVNSGVCCVLCVCVCVCVCGWV